MTLEQILAEYLERGGQLWSEGDDLGIRAPKGVLTDALREGLRANKAALLKLVGAERVFAPISSQEQRLWYLHEHEHTGAAYNMDVAFDIEGALHLEALRYALETVVERHDPLRTAYLALDGQPFRVVHARVSVPINTEDLSMETPDRAQARADELGKELLSQPFDLKHAPLLRILVLRLGAEQYRLQMVTHHIATDGPSIQILVRELAVAYEASFRGESPELPVLSQSYSDCVARERSDLAEQIKAQLEYWRSELSGDLPPADLPQDFVRPKDGHHPAGRHTHDIASELHKAGAAYARERETTVFTVLLAAFNALLWRYARHDDILVGIASATRNQAGAQDLIGFFANTLPIRARIDPDMTFDDLTQLVHTKVRAARERDDTPFERIISEVRPKRQKGLTPLVHALFSMHRVERLSFESGGVRFDRIRLDRGEAKAPLAIVATTSGDKLRLTFDYDTAHFRPETIERMAGHYVRLLQTAIESPGAKVIELPLLAPSEREMILAAGASPDLIPALGQPVHCAIEARVQERPEANAVVCGDTALSYQDLNQQANALAHALWARGVRPGDQVGVCLPRSAEMVLAQLAALKMGAAYVALDPAQPPRRLNEMLRDAEAHIVLTASGPMDWLSDDITRLVVDLSTWTHTTASPDKAPPSEAAYVVFTSGSTGRPKGVLVPHSALSNLCGWFIERFGITTEDRVSCVFNPAFDALALEVWPCLAAGATLLFPNETTRAYPELLRDWILAQSITVAAVPTVLAQALIHLDWPADTSLRYLITGGERLRVTPVAPLPFRFINAYGPSENTVTSTYHEVVTPSTDTVDPPIGRAVSSTFAYVVDASGDVAPFNATGEIVVGGAQVAKGYLNRPEQTAERFVANPWGEGRIYRTGDLGKMREDGTIDFVGRQDDQVQLRGHRIELGEIEEVLTHQPGVLDAAVVMDEHSNVPRLTAYIVPTHDLDAQELTRAMQQELPSYMVPARLVALDALPRSGAGKIDRKRLSQNPPAGQLFDTSASDRVFPRNTTEKQLAALWTDLLDIETVGVYDDFFALGGHSLLATQLVSRVQSNFTVRLSLSDFLDAPHIAAMAQRIEQDLADALGTTKLNGPSRFSREEALARLENLSEEDLARALQDLD